MNPFEIRPRNGWWRDWWEVSPYFYDRLIYENREIVSVYPNIKNNVMAVGVRVSLSRFATPTEIKNMYLHIEEHRDEIHRRIEKIIIPMLLEGKFDNAN